VTAALDAADDAFDQHRQRVVGDLDLPGLVPVGALVVLRRRLEPVRGQPAQRRLGELRGGNLGRPCQ
jgi:hypothetical protein